MTTSQQLRTRLAEVDLLVVPGAYDALGARLIEQAGYDAVYMTGAGTSAARGFPDYGLLTLSEMAENAAVMARSIGVPLIADADTGYGNELNVTRTVREYEARGIAALHIEDQVAPKRCGHLDGKEVVTREEFISKIRAAVQARRKPDMVIIARTDARAVASLDEAVWRANAALDTGADMAFVEATQTAEEAAAVPRLVNGPCLLNMVPGGRTPVSDLRQVEDWGYKVALLPGLLLKAILDACDTALGELRRTQVMPSAAEPVAQTFRRLGSDEWDALRHHFNAGTRAAEER